MLGQFTQNDVLNLCVKLCELIISLHLFLHEFDIAYWLKTSILSSINWIVFLPQKWIEGFAL